MVSPTLSHSAGPGTHCLRGRLGGSRIYIEKTEQQREEGTGEEKRERKAVALGSSKNRVGDKNLYTGSRFWEVPQDQEGGTGRSDARKEGEPSPGCLCYQVSLPGGHLGRGPAVYLRGTLQNSRERRWDIYPPVPALLAKGNPGGCSFLLPSRFVHSQS